MFSGEMYRKYYGFIRFSREETLTSKNGIQLW